MLDAVLQIIVTILDNNALYYTFQVNCFESFKA